LMAMALGALKECSNDKSLSIRASFESCQVHDLSPLKKVSNFAEIFLESMGRTMNRETSIEDPYKSERIALRMTVHQGLQKISAGQKLDMHHAGCLDEPTIISGGTSGLGLLIGDYLKDQIRTLISFSRSGTLNSISKTSDATSSSLFVWTIQMCVVYK